MNIFACYHHYARHAIIIAADASLRPGGGGLIKAGGYGRASGRGSGER